MRSVLTLVVALGCWLSAAPAHAHGYCDPEQAADLIHGIELFAKGKATAMPDDWGCVEDTIAPDPKLAARMIAACTKVVETHDDDAGCVTWSVQAGAKTLGKLDLFTAMTSGAAAMDPLDGWFAAELLVKLDDARALPILRAAWTAGAEDKRVARGSHEMTYRWAKWRHTALPLFASRGAAEDATFLAEQLPKTDDKIAVRAIRRAIAAIEKRAKL